MKKFIFVITLTVFTSAGLMAQNEVPDFGKYSESDKNLSKVSYDDGAGAVYIFNVGKTHCSYSYTYNTYINILITRHVRIKVLDKKGLSEGNVSFQYASGSDGQTVRKLHAQTVNFNDQGEMVVSKVEKSMIFDKKKTKRVNEITIAFPEVRPGSIIEYEYEIESNGMFIPTWYFQSDIPVEYSRYVLDFPFEIKVTAQPQGIFQVNQETKSAGSRYQKIFTLEHIPGLRNESYISNPIDYMQRVVPILVSQDLPGVPSRRLIKGWDEIVNELEKDEDFGGQLKKNIPRTSDLDEMLKGVNDEYVKMDIIYKYVRNNMHLDDISGIWSFRGIKTAWKEKKGTVGEINLILINLLKDAGLNACPILVSTHDNGMTNPSITNLGQFNSVMGYVQLANRTYILDATEKYTPVSLIPESVLYSQGFVIENPETNKWGWKQILDDTYGYTTYVSVHADIGENGIMKGKAMVRADDYERISRTEFLNTDNENYAAAYFKINDANTEIDSLITENKDKEDLSLIQYFNFKQPIASTGDYHFIPVNMFGNLDKNLFINNERVSDILFKAKKTYVFDETITIPEGYHFDDLPKNMLMRMPDSGIVFKRVASVDGNTLNLRMEIEFAKPIYGFDEYDYFHEFYKKLFGFLNEQFIFKKN